MNVAMIIWRAPGRKAAIVGDHGNRLGDVGRDFTDPRQRRIKAALRDVGVG